MKKQIIKFNIFEIEHFNGLLNDFETIFKGKNVELNKVLSSNTLESIKKERINTLLFVFLSYNDAFKDIKARFLAFKKAPEFKDLSSNSLKLVEDFGKKINKNIVECKKLIEKCEAFLNSDEKTTDLM